MSDNRLLQRLLRHDPSLESRLRVQDYPAGFRHVASGSSVTHVLFPMGSVVALMVSGAGGEQAGVRAVGAEGMAGIGALIGSLRSEVSVVQQVAGAVASCPTQALRRSQEQHPEVARLVLRYASYALRVAQQTVACNVLHTARQRAARWILCTADRKGREEFDLTQDLLAQMLGVTRQFTSGITAELRADGVIAYHRGALRILKREVLQRRACDCYQVMQGMLRELQDR